MAAAVGGDQRLVSVVCEFLAKLNVSQEDAIKYALELEKTRGGLNMATPHSTNALLSMIRKNMTEAELKGFDRMYQALKDKGLPVDQLLAQLLPILRDAKIKGMLCSAAPARSADVHLAKERMAHGAPPSIAEKAGGSRDHVTRKLDFKAPAPKATKAKEAAIYYMPRPNATKLAAITDLPPEARERVIVDDLVKHVLTGCPGEYIYLEGGKLHTPPQLDASLSELANRMTGLFEHVNATRRFARRVFELNGQVLQALSEAVRLMNKEVIELNSSKLHRELLAEYSILCAQIDNVRRNGGLTLQRLWGYMQETAGVMRDVSDVITAIDQNKLRGAAVLSMLHDRALKAVRDQDGKSLMGHLLEKAARPYFEMLDSWLHEGTLDDPYGEFFVKIYKPAGAVASATRKTLQAWQAEYALVPDCIPVFLGRTLAEKCLTTGMYLRVVAECSSQTAPLRPHAPIQYTDALATYETAVNAAFAEANIRLLALLFNEKALTSHLRSMRHFLLFDRGDLMQQLLENMESELSKTSKNINEKALRILLEETIQSSSVGRDPHTTNVRAHLSTWHIAAKLRLILDPIDDPRHKMAVEIDELTGYGAFGLHYSVEWPLSIALDRDTVSNHEMMFRHLLYCRSIQARLAATWKLTIPQDLQVDDASMRKVFAFQYRALTFTKNLMAYWTQEVIELNSSKLDRELLAGNFSTVDALRERLGQHVRTLLTECMVDNLELLRVTYRLLGTCEMFAKKSLDLARDVATHTATAASIRTYVKNVSQMETEFTRALRALHTALEARAAAEGGQRLSSLVLSLNCADAAL